MKKAIIFFSLLAGSCVANAQQSTTFKMHFMPQHRYKMTMNLSYNMEMNFSGDPVKIKAIQDKGIKLPMLLDSKMKTVADITAGNMTGATSFPLKMVMEPGSNVTKLNGVEKPAQPNPMAGQTILATATTDGKLDIQSISGQTLPDNQKAMISKAIDNAVNQMHFPDRPMKPGDKFTQEIPFAMPMVGSGLEMKIKIIYTLKSIKNGLAYFDMDETLSLDLEMLKNNKTVNATAQGSGGGHMVYSIANSYYVIRQTTLSMHYNFSQGALKIAGKGLISANSVVDIK